MWYDVMMLKCVCSHVLPQQVLVETRGWLRFSPSIVLHLVLKILKIILCYLYGHFMCMYVCVSHVYHVCTWRGQKKAWELELKLQIIVSYHVDTRTWTQPLWRSSQCAKQLSDCLHPQCISLFCASVSHRTWSSQIWLGWPFRNSLGSFCV